MGYSRQGEAETPVASCLFGSTGCWWFGEDDATHFAGYMQAGGQISRDVGTGARVDEKHGLLLTYLGT